MFKSRFSENFFNFCILFFASLYFLYNITFKDLTISNSESNICFLDINKHEA